MTTNTDNVQESDYDQLHQELAKVAYLAYRDAVGRRAVNGDLLPDWETLPTRIRCAWIESTRAVCINIADRLESLLYKDGEL